MYESLGSPKTPMKRPNSPRTTRWPSIWVNYYADDTHSAVRHLSLAYRKGNDLLREGFARHVSGEGAGQFEGTDKAFYALHLPIPSPLPSNRKVNEHASLTVDTKAPQILRSLPNPVHLPGFIKKYHSFEIYRTSL
eukprot:25956-Amorphochlora_amoeboformis.AAC.1